MGEAKVLFITLVDIKKFIKKQAIVLETFTLINYFWPPYNVLYLKILSCTKDSSCSFYTHTHTIEIYIL